MITDILRNKRDDRQEYTIHLFEYCNLSCSFCWQDHDSLVGVDEVMSRLDSIKIMLDKEVKSRAVFNIMGGEVFAPAIFTPEMRKTYIDLAKGIVAIAKERGIEVTLNWVTNLAMEDRTQLNLFIEDCRDEDLPTEFSTSYDPKGRFNRKQFKIYKANLEYYGPDMIRTVALVLTKQNIEEFLKDENEFFKWIYDSGFAIYFDYLMPDSKTNAVPSDTDLFNMFKFLIDNYPRCEPISGWLTRLPSSMSCKSSKLILEDGTICGCGNLIDPKVAKEIYEVPLNPTNNFAIEDNFMEKYGCLTCEYFNRCELGCFMQHNYKFRDEMDECVYKVTHRYIDSLHTEDVSKIPIVNL